MLEKALTGSRRYWTLVVVLLAVIGMGVGTYFYQLREGLGVTGLGRDIPWGFYIAQFTFMVGVAASAVMLVLPYYLHNFKAFGKVVILGEFLAIAAVSVCMLFIFVDMGQPMRVLNVMLHPTPNSPMFWDMVSLMGYFGLNAVIAYITFGAEKKGVAPPKWIKPIIILSIPWAVSIHTVTAFLYAGLEARHFWMTAILAPRFLASAFASGPSLLILLCLTLRKLTKFDVGDEAIDKLGQIVTYALSVSIFFFAVELFTALYSDMPGHTDHFKYLFIGLNGKGALVPWMWFSQILGVGSLLILVFPGMRKNHKWLARCAAAIIVAIWIEKGLGMIVAGFVPNTFHEVIEYAPTTPELMIALGVYGIGAFILTILYKIAVSVREELAS
ncbi:MAG: polysulfide reductase NrfD [Deltaproteobacteria bacterium]|jgi:molybdopterin-containing oxidoreductase family membrane subunit|nr:polysulfide reductase NrfD [Deltaproteobacteria bacterium]MBW2534424.1 polysulfide reductase NrfD [Deltaproteobacteria bacterium]